MNENAKLWVEALRSGDYEQGVHHLRGEDGYCCLGVACDLYRQRGGGEWVQLEGRNWSRWAFGNKRHDLPSNVQAWLGLASPSGDFGDNDALVIRNDHSQPFPEIADLIESEPKGLFS